MVVPIIRAIAVCAFLQAGVAFAQSCHIPVVVAPDARGLTLAAGFQAGAFQTARYTGGYQGTFFNAVWDFRWLRAEAYFPQYRIVRNGLAAYGLGDLSLGVQAPVYSNDSQVFSTGVGMFMSLPTGDPHKDLGMGHAMLMPEVWARLTGTRAMFESSLTYGASLVGGGHQHAAGPGPLVNPMNSSELELKLMGAYKFHELLQGRVGTCGAAPIGVSLGASRAAVFAGASMAFGKFNTGLDVHLPVHGDPFQVKFMMTAALTL